jgi:hypothetical protein
VREEQRRTAHHKKREGDVTIEKNRTDDSGTNREMGDYVDYEEVDD